MNRILAGVFLLFTLEFTFFGGVYAQSDFETVAGAIDQGPVTVNADVEAAAVSGPVVSALATTTPPDGPWEEYGVSPMRQYFEDMDEYVSPGSGPLTVCQVDFVAPGRDLPLKIGRVYQSPLLNRVSSQPEIEQPPYADLGPGWCLDLPWVGMTYLRLWHGQSFRHGIAGLEGHQTFENRKGGHFVLDKYDTRTGTGDDATYSLDHWTLWTEDGTYYYFDRYGCLTSMTSPNGNKISFSYTNTQIGKDDSGDPVYAQRLTQIVDTIGRTVTFTHLPKTTTQSPQLSCITIKGPDSTVQRMIRFTYDSHECLAAVDDILAAGTGSIAGHQTKFTYRSTPPYYLTSITYPTGGVSKYTWDSITEYWGDFGVYKYRVTSQERKSRAGVYTPGDVYRTFSYSTDRTKSTVETRDQSSDAAPKQKEVFTVRTSDGVVTRHQVFNSAGTEVRKVDYTYNDSNEITKETQTLFAGSGAPAATTTKEWVYDTWGNVTQSKDELGFTTYTAYANGNGAGKTSGTWTSSDFYANSVTGTIMNRPVGSYYYQDKARTVKVESYNLYDTKGNLLETKQKLVGDSGASWLKSANHYATSGSTTYGPTKTIRGAHLAQSDWITTDLSYNPTYLAFPESVTTDTVTTANTYYYDIGKVKTKQDGNGNVTEFRYDLLGRPILTIYPAVNEVQLAAQMEYPVVNGVTTAVTSYGIWNPTSQSVSQKKMIKRYTFDGFGRQALVETFLSEADYLANIPIARTSTTYNWQGLKASETTTRSLAESPTEYVTTYEYDLFGRVTKITNPDGSQVIQHDDARDWTGDSVADGRVKTVFDERQHKIEYFYDWIDRLVKVNEYPDGVTPITTAYEYDAAGNLIRVTDGRSKNTLYTYDTLNRLRTTTYPRNQAGYSTLSLLTYDDYGRLKTRTDQKGVVTGYVYDKLDNLTVRTEKKPTDASPIEVAWFTYDANGNQTSASDPLSTITRVFDSLNRLTSEAVTTGGRTYQTTKSYDSYGQLANVVSPMGKGVAYEYDDAGRLLSVERGQVPGSPVLASYTYHPVGIPKTIIFGNGAGTTYRLDPNRPRVYRITTASPSGNTLLDLIYQFEADGNIRAINNDQFQYDGLGRLTDAVNY